MEAIPMNCNKDGCSGNITYGGGDIYERGGDTYRVETGSCSSCGETVRAVWKLEANVTGSPSDLSAINHIRDGWTEIQDGWTEDSR